MRYLKTFESITGFDPTDIIEQYWEVDFNLLKDMIDSLALTYDSHEFEIVFYIRQNGDTCRVFEYNGVKFKEGPYWNNLSALIENGESGHSSIEPNIEFWVEMPNDYDGFVKDLNNFISDSGIPYHSSGVIELSENIFFSLRYSGDTEIYQNYYQKYKKKNLRKYGMNESSLPDTATFVMDKWNIDPYEFRDIVTATLEGFDEHDFEIEFSIIYKNNRHHVIKFNAQMLKSRSYTQVGLGKLVWNVDTFYAPDVYVNLIKDVPDDVEFCISLSLPIDRNKDNADYVKSICKEFDERLGLWGSDWRPKEIIDILREGTFLTMIGFLPSARKGYVKKINPLLRKKK